MRALEKADAQVKAGADVQYLHSRKQLKTSEQISNLTKLYQAGYLKRNGENRSTMIKNFAATRAADVTSEYTPSEMIK